MYTAKKKKKKRSAYMTYGSDSLFFKMFRSYFACCHIDARPEFDLQILLLLLLVGWNWVSWYCGHYWPIIPPPDDRWWWLWRNWWNEDCQGKPKYSEKTCPSATLSTTNPTWLDPDSNPCRRGGKLATNGLSYGAALSICFLWHWTYIFKNPAWID
jgi:hypothetical protein